MFSMRKSVIIFFAIYAQTTCIITAQRIGNSNLPSSTTTTTTEPIILLNESIPVKCGSYNKIAGSIHNQQSSRTPRIIGGQDALIEEFPWHGSLQKLRLLFPLPIPDWHHICGASIINEHYLLTAAHCVDGLINSWWPGQLRVVLGTDRWRYTLFQRNIQMIPVAKIIIHPEWNSRRAQNDIALIRTTKPIVFNQRVRPICLPKIKDYELNNGQSVTVAGYGFTTDNLVFNFLPDRLKAVRIPVVRMDNCRQTYNISRIPITNRMICAGVTTYGRCSGAMRGDSGSALISYMDDNDRRAIHTGIVSFSLPCRMYGAPDVYTRTSSYIEWIDNVINDRKEK
ncbi:Group 3 mite allergen-like protein (serine protease) [Euroglyphus maynei]|uniref:Group 3 mite allergen-like protein (Serine protease) n=1 Tax=Euroglyphus maynei TaxID=6958 RepID=A0A1Y3ARF2_EURMA|nr:Group 3 mite allergen-like protein (serine protease) [Euroglyphus maynei]